MHRESFLFFPHKMGGETFISFSHEMDNENIF